MHPLHVACYATVVTCDKGDGTLFLIIKAKEQPIFQLHPFCRVGMVRACVWGGMK